MLCLSAEHKDKLRVVRARGEEFENGLGLGVRSELGREGDGRRRVNKGEMEAKK